MLCPICEQPIEESEVETFFFDEMEVCKHQADFLRMEVERTWRHWDPKDPEELVAVLELNEAIKLDEMESHDPFEFEP